MKRRALCLLVVALAAAPPEANSLPEWLRQATADEAGSKAGAVILVDDLHAQVARDGNIRTRRRYAARVHERDAASAAALQQVYVQPAGKIREVRGWILGRNGLRKLDARHVVDVAAVDDDVYNEVRVRQIAAIDDIAPGELFAAEIEADERLPFSQIEWSLQGRWPVRVVRRSLELPDGWTPTGLTFNAPPIEPRFEAGKWTWERRDFDAVTEERDMPPLSSIAARLALSFGAPRNPSSGQFQNWRAVATWLNSVSHEAGADEKVIAKARELTRGASSRMERVRVLAEFVQRMPYISIQTGLGRGGGYQPRPTDVVLARNYGDCKDKASLLRSFLRAIDVESHLLFLYAGDPDYVRPEWPSPQQFNHAIIAIVLHDAAPDASVIDHDTLGRLLLFDPTDEYTPLGELPLSDQGSLGLIAGDSTLRRLPTSSPERAGVHRVVEVTLDASGSVTGTVREVHRGEDAAETRRSRRLGGPGGYRASMERRLAAVLPGARVTEFASEGDDVRETAFEMRLHVPRLGQVRGRLLIVKPLVGLDSAALTGPEPNRRYPFVQRGIRREEHARLILPDDTRIEELPRRVSVSNEFGSYSLTYAEERGAVAAHRTVTVPRKAHGVAEQAGLRAFLEIVRNADQSPIVLVKQ